ncbi:MAG: hypothetical protein HOE80_04410 [Candidatus Magasanikbacteria bacterium]|jgi:hypothetical protein|nr:hypothetical protein [Candidatus Magasanikbacteria bacterium]MBT4071935.1 hypothetical protein [Candidatus Magasanikbacteria bacterium]
MAFDTIPPPQERYLKSPPETPVDTGENREKDNLDEYQKTELMMIDEYHWLKFDENFREDFRNQKPQATIPGTTFITIVTLTDAHGENTYYEKPSNTETPAKPPSFLNENEITYDTTIYKVYPEAVDPEEKLLYPIRKVVYNKETKKWGHDKPELPLRPESLVDPDFTPIRGGRSHKND